MVISYLTNLFSYMLCYTAIGSRKGEDPYSTARAVEYLALSGYFSSGRQLTETLLLKCSINDNVNE